MVNWVPTGTFLKATWGPGFDLIGLGMILVSFGEVFLAHVGHILLILGVRIAA